MQQVNILIATIDNRITGLRNVVKSTPNKKYKVTYTISHQLSGLPLTSSVLTYTAYLKKDANVIYSSIHGKGVARNRNNALKHRIKGAICILADDDIEYFENGLDNVIHYFNYNPNVEFLNYKIISYSGNDYKKYKDHEFRHNILSLTMVGIVDIAFREEVIEKYSLEFDNLFGPGTDYGVGEDYIFIMDAWRRGAKIIFNPINVVKHGETGTGSSLSPNVIRGRGAVFSRVFGAYAVLTVLYYSLKKYPMYKGKYSLKKYFKLMQAGIRDHREKHHRFVQKR